MDWFKYLIIVAEWSAYLAVHSVLARNDIKEFFESRVNMGRQGYRFFYVSISTIGVLFIFFHMALMESNSLFSINKGLQYLGMVLSIWGILLVSASFRKLSGASFLGLKKAEDKGLVTEGIHGKIRHPIYSGTILVFLGMFFYVPTDIVLTSILTIFSYLPIGIYYEEIKLIEEFGEEYKAYKQEVPALIPKLF